MVQDARSLKIRRVKITELHADPANARTHGERNLRAIEDSLKSFGQVEPLVVQKSTGKVIGGNGRLEVMRRAGIEECDVVEVDVDDAKATALGIALNRTAELAVDLIDEVVEGRPPRRVHGENPVPGYGSSVNGALCTPACLAPAG